MKKNPIRLWFAFIMLFVFSNNACSTHLVSAEITYSPVPGSPNEYLINLLIYKDCHPSSAPLSNSIDIEWNSPSGCGSYGITSLVLVQGTGVGNSIHTSLFPVCDSSFCDSPPGTAYGVDLYIYSGNILLSANCPDWEITFLNCCRNSIITTGPNDENMFVSTSMDNLNFPTDRSPVFNHPSVATTCIGRPYIFDLSASDPDGDSLVYVLSDSWSAAGYPCNYNPPYSGSNPVASFPLPSLNSQTGLLTVHPTMVQIGIFAVLVKAYDVSTGMLKSITRRDAQLNIELICNDPPHIDSTQLSLNNQTANCGATILHLKLSWEAKCFSLASDGSDFRLYSPTGLPVPITSAIAHNCSGPPLGSLLTDSITLTILSPGLVENGNYLLISQNGYDGNTLLDDCGRILPVGDTCIFSFSNCPVGMEETTSDPLFLEIYPNPSDQNLTVKTNVRGNKKIRVYSSDGACVFQLQTHETIIPLNLAFLADGLYYLESLSEGVSRRALFVVSH